MKTLDGLAWVPKWVSYLGSMKGCFDYLGIEISDAWLYGASGHAFILNIHNELCPSGPTSWKSNRMTELCMNCGCDIENIASHKYQKGFTEAQKRAWNRVRFAIDRGLPSFAWEMAIPEYYVIYGYDKKRYIFHGPMRQNTISRIPWDELGTTEIGFLEVYIISPSDPARDELIVRDALEYAVEWSNASNEWTLPDYTAGPMGYDVWMGTLENNIADGLGAAYNAAVWAECRYNAVDFLREAKNRLDDSMMLLFDDAIARYKSVSDNLNLVSGTYPFLDATDEQRDRNVRDTKRKAIAIRALERAKKAEEKGIASLRKILDSL